MKWLLAMVKERGLLVDTISYIYNDKWQKDRIHPGLVGRVQRQLDEGLGLPVFWGQQPQSGRM